ncbi:hypothetical protein [Aquirufa antheringensis]|uniref:hypothetical protein n=1 Tax=Aquirufa antheringensis TaxID=2516559 RepID=UPI00208EF8CD|nr:hypothetical protein [Aquirufa antheringensis]USQ03149.1 hypothetical protein G9X63_03170 [Aquirufa antheringensis]
MEHKKKLFSIDNENIRVMINLGFDGEDLKLDGYDIGKSVSDMWGDSDYEYSITVSEGELPRLYELNRVPFGNKKKLISVLAKFLSDNKAFTLFHDYLKENNIPFTCFSY